MKKIFQSFNKERVAGHIRLGFFFHRRGVLLQKTPVRMSRTLLHQLLSQVPSVRGEFQYIWDENKKWQDDFGRDWDWRIEEL